MGQFLQESIRNGSLRFYRDYRLGTFADLSRNDNDASTKSNIKTIGDGVKFMPDNGYELTDDQPNIRLTTGTAIMKGIFNKLERTGSPSRLISKRDAGGTNFEIMLDSTPRIFFYDGIATRQLDYNYIIAKSIGVIFSSGETATGWRNGLEIGDFSGESTISEDDSPLYIGNSYALNRSLLNILQSVLIFNRKLDGHEMAIAHSELMEIA